MRTMMHRREMANENDEKDWAKDKWNEREISMTSSNLVA